MRELPILMNGDMVRAIIDGTKTQTRRPVKAHDGFGDIASIIHADYHSIFGPDAWIASNGTVLPYTQTAIKPPYRKGDTLWVRETWRLFDAVDECGHSDAPCGCPRHGAPLYKASNDDGESKWRPSIHMPRWAARIFLTVKSVRVERVQDISESDCLAEGLTNGDRYECCHDEFRTLWDSIYAPRGLGWAANPWVWVTEFTVAKR